MSKRKNKFSPELRERAVRMVLDGAGQHGSLWQAITSISAKIGRSSNKLNDWGKRAKVNSEQHAGIPSEMAEKMTSLERDNRELRQVADSGRTRPVISISCAHPFRFYPPMDSGACAVLLQHVAQKWEPVLRFSDMRKQKDRVWRVNANERDALEAR